MKYLCLIYGDMKKLAALSREEMAAMQRAGAPHFEALSASGAMVIGFSGLGPEHKSIRPGEGAPLVTDGPFVEAKEQVGGFFVIEARDLDEALKTASLHPGAHMGKAVGSGIEVRPIPAWEFVKNAGHKRG